MSPLSNSFLREAALHKTEPFFPLHAYVCEHCFLVQLNEFETPENIFKDYAYFSSYSDSWLRHCETYTQDMVARFALGSRHQVVEIASNDGYLLKFFKAQGLNVLGVEPARNVAEVALAQGIPTEVSFFGREVAEQLVGRGVAADLLLGNNVLAHVPDLNDFVSGMKTLLRAQGVITMEFPHLVKLMESNQFDTIYHEHFSYFSFLTVARVFAQHGLDLFDVEELPTHGGSIRIFAQHQGTGPHSISDRVAQLRNREFRLGLNHVDTYTHFSERVEKVKCGLLEFLNLAKRNGKKVVGYGAPAKGNTLLNFCGVGTDLIEYTVDRSPHKQGKWLPGTHIPIYAPERLLETQPDYVLILPWNLRDEIVEQIAYVREWGGHFVIPIPALEVLA